jgi:hypothetical protein
MLPPTDRYMTHDYRVSLFIVQAFNVVRPIFWLEVDNFG